MCETMFPLCASTFIITIVLINSLLSFIHSVVEFLLLCYNTLWNQFESQVEFLAMTPDNIELQLPLTDSLR